MACTNLLTNQRKRRVRNSFLAVSMGWAMTNGLLAFAIVLFAFYQSVTGKVEVPGASPFIRVIAGTLGLIFVFAFPLVIALFYSGFISLAGWLLLGLPIALLVNDRTANNFVYMVMLHLGLTIAFFRLFLRSWPWEGGFEDSLATFGYWGMAIGVIGGAFFWVFNRNDRLKRLGR